MMLRGENMYIGPLKITDKAILAPMAGVTDFPFRQIVREIGGQLLFTEMVSSKGLVYGNQNTSNLLNFKTDKQELIGIQIFGSEAEFMKKAAVMIEKQFEPDIIDINMGCPAPKIIKNEAGSALMNDVNKAEEIMKEVVNAVELPVTVKMRKGWDDNSINAVEISQMAQNAGIKAVTVHGRTREQFYKGNSDWKIFKKVKEKVKIPVIGNGDIFSPADAAEMLEETGCDAVMVARGIQGNPWLIKRVNHFLKTGELLPEPNFADKIKIALYHLQKAVNYFGEKRGIPKMRKHLSWYLKGMPYASKIKDKINQSIDKNEVDNILNEYLNDLRKYKKENSLSGT